MTGVDRMDNVTIAEACQWVGIEKSSEFPARLQQVVSPAITARK